MPTLDAVPPNSPEAEQAVLGAMMLNRDAARVALELLRADDFYTERHRVFFRALTGLYNRNLVGDPVIALEELRRDSRFETIGGGEYVGDVVARCPTFANAEHYCRIVAEKALRRHLIDLGRKLHQAAFDGADLDDCLAEHQKALDDITPPASTKELPWAAPDELSDKQPEMLVEILAPKGMFSLLHGLDKVGKSLWAMELVRAVATGTPAFGRFSTARKGMVLLAALDDPECITRARLFYAGLIKSSNVAVLHPGLVDLSDPDAFLKILASDIHDRHVNLVIIDALYLFSPKGEGGLNDVSLVRPLMQAFNRLAEESGAAVVLIHHDRRDASGFAGSYAIRAMAKHALHLAFPRNREGAPDEESTRRELSIVSKLIPASKHILELTGTSGGTWAYEGLKSEVVVADIDARLLEMLSLGLPLTQSEIIEASGKRRGDVRQSLARLVQSNQLTCATVPNPHGGPRRLQYVIVTAGKPAGEATEERHE